MIKILSFLLIFPCMVFGGDISGTIKIMKKDGKKEEKSFENAVVYISGIETKPDGTVYKVIQEGQKFIPRVLPIVKGSEVEFKNLDTFSHNVFSSDPKKTFDLGKSAPKTSDKVKFDEAIEGLKIYCNIHQTMVCDILVLENKYFATTNEKGEFTIKDVPEGKYKIKVWHIYGGTIEQEIEVKKEAITQDLTVTSTKVVRELTEHKNKEGKEYPRENKY